MNPMKPAVNTVTLRAFSPEEIVSILQDNQIDAVEWAGDAHVPPGKLETAESVRALCDANGITCTSYGSYYQCDHGGQGNGPFQHDLGAEPALNTARALGVSAVRVWAGRQASELASEAYRKEVADCMRSFCEEARAHGMTVHLEFHRNTLTDTAESTLALLNVVSMDNLYSYWQPRHGVDVAGNLSDINTLGTRLSNVHVFHWNLQPDGKAVDRRPLREGLDRWQQYFKAIEQIPGERYAMMEFVRNDDMDQFKEDAALLRSLCGV